MAIMVLDMDINRMDRGISMVGSCVDSVYSITFSHSILFYYDSIL